MSSFALKNIKRRMFVIKGSRLFIASSKDNCSHGAWFKQEGWMSDVDGSFLEKNPRGYVDSEGIYLYQGHKATIPKIETELLRNVIIELKERLNLKNDLHVFLGSIIDNQKKHGKRQPQKDLGILIKFTERH